MEILLDTNFLIDIVRFKIDLGELYSLVGRFELFTISSVIDELKRIAKTTSREGKCAKIALQLIEKRRVEILKIQGSVDKTILKLVDKETAVATNDMALRKLLKAKGTKTIYIKSKKHLGVD